MDSNEILNKIIQIRQPSECTVVFPDNYSNNYFGKDKDNYIVFMLPSKASKLMPIFQETKSLSFAFNKKCRFQAEDYVKEQIMHVLTCKVNDKDQLLAFIRLTRAFAQKDIKDDQFYLSKLFASISALFDRQKAASVNELQGLFAELYSILFLRDNGCDISKYWQSRSKMKFDFSLDEKKRLEIKSTIKQNRVHHFKHDQLLSELYDIKIVSIMLQKNDCGISLGDIIDQIREAFPDEYALLLRVESTIAHVSNEELLSIRYDQTYLDKNIRFFDALAIPHFSEKSPEGVFNAEYDCDLENIEGLTISEIKTWIGNQSESSD